MIDREIALRVMAFQLFGSEGFTDDTLDDFLWRATKALDDPKVLSDDLDTSAETMSLGLMQARKVFDNRAFRKWPLGWSGSTPSTARSSTAGPSASPSPTFPTSMRRLPGSGPRPARP